jgi:hypothetical protein
MASFSIVQMLMAAVFFLGRAVAHNDDMIIYNQWANSECLGHTTDEPRKLYREECQSRGKVNADAISLQIPHHKHRNKWVKQVEKGASYCWVTLYREKDCLSGDFEMVEVPKDVNVCLGRNFGYRSILFQCLTSQPQTPPRSEMNRTAYIHELKEQAKRITSTKHDIIPIEYAEPANRTIHHVEPIQQEPANQTNHHIEPRDDRPLVRPGHGDRVHARRGLRWYMHPWTLASPVCFLCWPKEKYGDTKFECLAKRATNHDCDEIFHGPTVTHFVTVGPRPTRRAVAYHEQPNELDKHTRRKIVRIPHPFHGGIEETCAKAKWHWPGSSWQELTLKGPVSCKNKEQDNIRLPQKHVTATVVPPEPTRDHWVEPEQWR